MHTRVLLVSDLPGLRRLKRRLLEVAGYEVGEVADGLAALERLRSSPTSLVVVMNTRIPGIDAGGILRAVIAEPALQRHGFVLSTALADMLPDGLGQLTGILQVPIIAKPFTGQGLLAAGLVVGVDRVGQAEELRKHGADIVVKDLAELLRKGDDDNGGTR